MLEKKTNDSSLTSIFYNKILFMMLYIITHKHKIQKEKKWQKISL